MDIPEDLLAKYKAYQISSKDVAALTGYHPVSIRRAIFRERPASAAQKKRMIKEIRNKYRASIAHLPAREIMVLANVSISTATRIRKDYGPGRPVSTR